MNDFKKLNRRKFLEKSLYLSLPLALPFGLVGCWGGSSTSSTTSGGPPDDPPTDDLFDIPVPDAGNVLVVYFLRGGIDGFSVVSPMEGNPVHGDYLSARKEIGSNGNPGTRVLNPLPLVNSQNWGLHPSLDPLMDVYNRGEMALTVGAGSNNRTRSHFAQMDYIETGSDVAILPDGYLNRALGEVGNAFPVQGITLDNALDSSLVGGEPKYAVKKLLNLSGTGGNPKVVDPYNTATQLMEGFTYNGLCSPMAKPKYLAEDLYLMGCENARINNVILDWVDQIEGSTRDIETRNWGNTNLLQAAKLLSGTFEANNGVKQAPVQMITLNHGGWDTHRDQGNDTVSTGLSGNLGGLAQGLRTFVDVAIEKGFWSRTTVVVMSEFGRTFLENGNAGTDHGRGSVMMTLGPNVNGNLVYGSDVFNILEQGQGNAIDATTDYRNVMREALVASMGMSEEQLSRVFPEFNAQSPTYRNLGMFR